MRTILVCKKNKLDISDDVVTLTASQAQDFVDFVRNRLNTSAWVTTGSVDADNTTIEVDFVNQVDIDTIALVKCNFKSYTVKYWNGSIYTDFSTPINPTNNTEPSPIHEFTKVTTTKILLTILGTFVADSEKKLYQFIATDKLRTGRLNGWPEIKNATFNRQRISAKMLSGKIGLKEQIGAFSFEWNLKVYSDSSDLAIFEAMYLSNNGFLVLLSGGDDSQFSSRRMPYRNEDWLLMKCSDEYTTDWYRGLYKSGQVINVKLVEVKD